MANLRISEFDLNGELSGSEVLLGVQNGNTTKFSLNNIKDFTTKLYSPPVNLTLSQGATQEVLYFDLLPNKVYTLDALMILENGNTDGIEFYLHAFTIDVVKWGLTYTLSNGVSGILEQVIPTTIADTTGINFIRINGLLEVGAYVETISIRAGKSTDLQPDYTLAASSYSRITA